MRCRLLGGGLTHYTPFVSALAGRARPGGRAGTDGVQPAPPAPAPAPAPARPEGRQDQRVGDRVVELAELARLVSSGRDNAAVARRRGQEHIGRVLLARRRVLRRWVLTQFGLGLDFVHVCFSGTSRRCAAPHTRHVCFSGTSRRCAAPHTRHVRRCLVSTHACRMLSADAIQCRACCFPSLSLFVISLTFRGVPVWGRQLAAPAAERHQPNALPQPQPRRAGYDAVDVITPRGGCPHSLPPMLPPSWCGVADGDPGLVVPLGVVSC